MRQRNWETHLRHELARRRREAEIAEAEARGAELALSRRLMPGEPHFEIAPARLRGDVGLQSAREAFRERHRRFVALRDECAGIEDDLGMAGADAGY